jgi:hypothetical protein
MAPTNSQFQNLEHLAITETRWVNTSALSRRYMDDRFLDAVDDLQDNHALNEDQHTVAHTYFSACLKPKDMRFLRRLQSQRFLVERDESSGVKNIRRVKGTDWYGMPTAFTLWVSGFKPCVSLYSHHMQAWVSGVHQPQEKLMYSYHAKTDATRCLHLHDRQPTDVRLANGSQ